MWKRKLAVGLLVGWAVLALSGCGGSSFKPIPVIQRGTLITFIGDSPVCDVLAFRPTITGLTLTPQGGGAEVPVFVATGASAPNLPVNVADLRDSSTILNLASVPVGTYQAATVTLSNNTLVLLDETLSPPVRTVTVTLSTKTPKGTILTPLVINPPVKDKTTGANVSQVSALRLDFNFLQSLGVDASGRVTGQVTPTFEMTAPVASPDAGFAEIEGLRGFVQRIDTVSFNTNFSGDIQVQLLAPTSTLAGAPSILVNLTASTQKYGWNDLNQVGTGSFVEVDGKVDSSANFIARGVDVQDREMTDQNKIAFIGYVLSVTKDSSGNVTQFNFYVHEEDPNPGFVVPLDSVLIVNPSASTVYRFSSPPTNFANLPFTPAAIVPGQELIVHGIFTVPPRPTPPALAPPSTVAADKIYLKVQTLQGGFSSLLQAGSDGKTGAFYLASCASLLQSAPVLVVTDNQTVFVNVSSLTGLTPQPTLLVKGLPFFESQDTTVNGVPVRAGTLVVLARKVHQLN